MASVITVGNFDGVHRGHQALLQTARCVAQTHERGADAQVIAITFDPHPASVLRPGKEPLRLSNRAQRLELLKQNGADRVVFLEPTAELLARSPEEFIAHLVQEHAPIAFVEGPNFHFGHNRAGNPETLERMGDSFGFTTRIVEPQHIPLTDQLLAPLSSTLIRQLLALGRVADAACALGRPYELQATVITGEQRGRTIDVPTANLDPQDLQGFVLPLDGVYVGQAVTSEGTTHAAAISVGVKPTFGRQQRVVEAHLLDFDNNLYNHPLTLRFTRWLRDQSRFPSLDALRQQLDRDLAATRFYRDHGMLTPPQCA